MQPLHYFPDQCLKVTAVPVLFPLCSSTSSVLNQVVSTFSGPATSHWRRGLTQFGDPVERERKSHYTENEPVKEMGCSWYSMGWSFGYGAAESHESPQTFWRAVGQAQV